MTDRYAHRDLFKQSEAWRAKARAALERLHEPYEVLPDAFVSEIVDAFIEAIVEAAVCQTRAMLEDDDS